MNACTGDVIGGAMHVHSTLGPGLLESAYRACLAHELRRRGHHVLVEAPLPVVYEGMRLDVGYRVDLVVDGIVMVEVKAVSRVLPVHEAQLISYLRLSGFQVGLILNFHEQHLRDGIRRFANGA